MAVITPSQLIRDYGDALDKRAASLFVGAGLSMAAGYPGWGSLIKDLRDQASVPADVTDMPLAAEYIVQTLPGEDKVLHQHILTELSKVTPKSTTGPRSISKLPLSELWTTNYDCLLEDFDRDLTVVASEHDTRQRHRPGQKRLMKMHGSLTSDDPPEWLAPPVITRSDYEAYADEHPRMWQALRSAYLTRTFLFLGFSFSDPNVDLLLRLSRSLRSSFEDDTVEHYTVLRKPDDPKDEKLHDFRVEDLSRSGFAVCVVDSHDDLEPLLRRLVRRTREKRLFVTGSGDSTVERLSADLGDRLATEHDIVLTSFANEATGLPASFAYANALQALDLYDPEAVRFYFRAQNKPGEALKQRTGTTVYTGLALDALRRDVLDDVRAVVVIGGGDRTAEELQVAADLGVPIVPLACSGGTAKAMWESSDVAQAVVDATLHDERDWTLLNDTNEKLALAACHRLIRRAMYLA